MCAYLWLERGSLYDWIHDVTEETHSPEEEMTQ